MIETLIAILLSLGLSFIQTDKGQIEVTESTMKNLEASEKYQSNFKPGESPIVVVPDIDPKESPIVVVPDIDPKY